MWTSQQDSNKICPSVTKIKYQIRTVQIFRYDVSKISLYNIWNAFIGSGTTELCHCNSIYFALIYEYYSDKRAGIQYNCWIHTGSPQLSYAIHSWKLYGSWNVRNLNKRLVCHKGVPFPVLKRHKNLYLWATNKRVVPKIMVHLYIIPTKGNCHCSRHHISKYAQGCQQNSDLKSHG